MDIDYHHNKEFFDVVYKEVHDEKLCLDLYYPNEIKKDMKVFIYIHGGGFLWYDKQLINEDHRINHVRYKDKLNSLGYLFVSVEYRRNKTEGYPCIEAQIEDVKDAIRWIKLNSETLGCSNTNIGLWGLSAGGALALSAALNPDILYHNSLYKHVNSQVKYVIDFYGITDIYHYYKLDRFNSFNEQEKTDKIDEILKHTNIDITDGKNFDRVKTLVDLHSPIYNYEKSKLKISIYHGTNDLVVDYYRNALAFYQHGLEHQNEIYLHPINDKDHGFWWDTLEFYHQLEDRTIQDIINFSEE